MPNSLVNRPTILVADDNELNRVLLADVLTAEDYDVIQAEDGDAALLAGERHQISLAVLDVMMPGKTGFEVCRTLKEQAGSVFIPVVLVTGMASFDERIEGIRAGADDFLSKPVNKQELLARTRSLLRMKEFTDE